MNKELTTVYVYKGRNYDSIPIKNYHAHTVDFKNGVKYVGIRSKIPMYIHLIIVGLLLIPLVKLNYDRLSKESIQVGKHTLRIPSEMYYDLNTKILDIDITNDGSNFETISFIIQDQDGDNIVELNGINPGESIGSIPVNYDFKKLPLKCKIIYKSSYQGNIFKDVKMDVLVVDRVVADKDLNLDF